MTTSVILDCDPGIDDALAIAFAHGHPAIDLLGLTTVAGNVGLARTTGNALAVAEFVGAADLPVTAGCQTPLVRPALDARQVHGETGLGGAKLPPPPGSPAPGHAVDYIIDTVRAAPGEITLVATGPLTNIALAVRKDPSLPGLVRDFVIMGGSAGRGNVTPAAEYNIWADPEAAAVVFGAGWTVRVLGLDVTLRTGAHAGVRAAMGSLGRLGTELLVPALEQYRSTAEPDGPAVHDVCALVYVADPTIFTMVPARVDVETAGRLTSGMTVTTFDPEIPNATTGMDIDVTRFWDLTLRTYGELAVRMLGRDELERPVDGQFLVAADRLLDRLDQVGVLPALPVAGRPGQRDPA